VPDTLYNDAVLQYDQGKLEDALRLYRETLSAHETAGNRNEMPSILNSIANVFADKGDQSRAKAMHERSIAACRAIDDKLNEAVALGNLGSLLADEGNLAGARTRYEETLEIKRSLGRPGWTAYTISSLGDLSLAQGDLANCIRRLCPCAPKSARPARLQKTVWPLGGYLWRREILGKQRPTRVRRNKNLRKRNGPTTKLPLALCCHAYCSNNKNSPMLSAKAIPPSNCPPNRITARSA
jgi:tetratricopeptide (TPR) repeat protein